MSKLSPSAGQTIPKAPKRQKMTERELAHLCLREFDDSQILTTEIQHERKKSLDYYNQVPFGNEEDGLSAFISSDVRDVIEWTLPQIVDVFVGGDSPIVFNPDNDGPEIEDAKIETAYCQYVFEQQNKGIILSAQWFKDALMQKNGMVKCWRQKEVKREREEYEGKSSADWLALSQDDEFDISECTITVHDVEYSEEEYTKIMAALPNYRGKVDAEAKYHIIGYRKKTVSQTVIENMPPENFFIQKDHNTVFPQQARYAGDFYEKSRSELLEMGYDYDLVMALPHSSGIAESLSNEGQARRRKEGGITMAQTVTSTDRSRELVMIYDHYIRADFNNDGYAELRHVRTAGKSNFYVLENEEVDRNPYHSLTPYINSFRFFGRSLADNLMDIQRAKSQLWRNSFDNVAYSAIPRKVVSGNVDIAALMTYVQGGIIKKDLNATVENEITPFVADSALAMADKVDQLRSERSGFSKETMGLDPTALANATNPVGMSILAQSQLLVKMIATIFAHTGFQSLMEHIRELVIKYEDGEKIFELTGKKMSTDLRRWRKQRSSTVKVGIGFAGKQEELSVINNLMTVQQQFILAQGGQIDGPLTNAKGIYNTIQRLCSRMGIKDAETYFTDPATYKPPTPQPTIAEKTLGAQINNIGNQQQIQEAKMILDEKNAQHDHELNIIKVQNEHALKILQIQSDEKMHEQTLLAQYGEASRKRAEVPIPHISMSPQQPTDNPTDKLSSFVTAVSDQKKGQAGAMKAATASLDKAHKSLADTTDKAAKMAQTHQDTVNSLAGNMSDGLKALADAHKQSSQEIVKALTRKKKATLSSGKTVEIE